MIEEGNRGSGNPVSHLEHISGMAKRLRGLHEATFYPMLPQILGLTRMFLSREKRFKGSRADQILGIPVENGPNMDWHIALKKDNTMPVGEQIREREYHNVLIDFAIGAAFGNLGCRSRIMNNFKFHQTPPDIIELHEQGKLGKIYDPDRFDGYKGKGRFFIHYRSIPIPGTNGRVSNSINIYQHGSDMRYDAPLYSVQIVLGPITDREERDDRRIFAVNRRQMAVKQYMLFDEGVIKLIGDYKKDKKILKDADRIDEWPESLPKLATTGVRMARMLGQLSAKGRNGQPFLKTMYGLSDMDNRGIERETRERMRQTILDAITKGNIAGEFTGPQKTELTKDVFLNLFFPYGKRTMIELGIFELFPKLRGVFKPAGYEDPYVFVDELENKKSLEFWYEVAKKGLKKGGATPQDAAGEVVYQAMENFLAPLKLDPGFTNIPEDFRERMDYIMDLFNMDDGPLRESVSWRKSSMVVFENLPVAV